VDINGLLVNATGFIATLFSIVMWVPQARITWRNRHDAVRLAGVSETTQWFSMIGYLLWGVFGIMIGSFWVAAPSVVSFPLSLATIIVVRRARRMSAVTSSVSIITMSEPFATTDVEDAVPILASAAREDADTATPVTVAAADRAESRPPTTPIPVLA